MNTYIYCELCAVSWNLYEDFPVVGEFIMMIKMTMMMMMMQQNNIYKWNSNILSCINYNKNHTKWIAIASQTSARTYTLTHMDSKFT